MLHSAARSKLWFSSISFSHIFCFCCCRLYYTPAVPFYSMYINLPCRRWYSFRTSSSHHVRKKKGQDFFHFSICSLSRIAHEQGIRILCQICTCCILMQRRIRCAHKIIHLFTRKDRACLISCKKGCNGSGAHKSIHLFTRKGVVRVCLVEKDYRPLNSLQSPYDQRALTMNRCPRDKSHQGRIMLNIVDHSLN